MRRLRYDGRVTSWLAIQLALSFGHVHLNAIRRSDPAVAVLDRYTHTAQLALAQQRGNTTDHDYCAICASIYLASNSFVPAAPQLPVPLVSHAVEHSNRSPAVFVGPRRSAFQSRAPPLA
jgi:hypothetical protein